MSDVLTTISTRATPQNERADERQVPNSAGGYAFPVDREQRLRRFLTLGVAGGTYYAGERDLALDNFAVLTEAARDNATRLVELIVEISTAGRAPRQQPALFALAVAAGTPGDPAGRRAALDALPQVARTASALMTFTRYMRQFRGWGRQARRGVAAWYLDSPTRKLEYQVAKYRHRDGYRHRDLLRLSHPVTSSTDTERRGLFNALCDRDIAGELPLYRAFLDAQAATKTAEWVRLVEAHGLAWEMLPDAALREPAVWCALIDRGMPQTALIRQLPRLTRLGVLRPLDERTRRVAAQLADQDHLIKARVHPVNVLVANRTYAAGRSTAGTGTWTPVREILDALDLAFYASFGAVQPAGKRTVLALDVSASMSWTTNNMPITAREASAALSLVTAATEPATTTMGFSTRPLLLDISPRQRLDDVIRTVSGLPHGGTDCALPMLWALDRGIAADTFVIYTDSETWYGDIHPHQALRRYREQTGIAARMIVVGLTATNVTIADPADPGMLDIAGFDSKLPNLITDFSRGDL